MFAEEFMESERRNGERRLVLPAGMELVVPPRPKDEAGDEQATASDEENVRRPEPWEPRDGGAGARP
jgi:hypothetical protein